MRSIKTVIRENGLVVQKCLFPEVVWVCRGEIAGIPNYCKGKSARDSVNSWLSVKDFHDQAGLFRRSASITSQE